MFFGNRGKQKKVEALLEKGQQLVQAGTFGEARKAAEEAFTLACTALSENASLAGRAHALLLHTAVRLDDWGFAQSSLEHALRLFEAEVSVDSPGTVSLRRSLLDIYSRRENHLAAAELVKRTLPRLSDQHPEHAILRALSAPSLAALGRVDDAVGTAQRAFEEASQRFGKQTEAYAVTCRQLARVLIETGRDPATGFRLVDSHRLREAPRSVDELMAFLRDSQLMALAKFQAGDLNEAALFLELTMKITFTPVSQLGGPARLLRGKLEALHAEALAALGRVSDAESTVRGAIRDVETSAGPRHPDLIPLLESHARVLRTKEDGPGAEVQEKRAAALRSLLTGKKVAPVKQEPRKAVTSVWPRRTLSGVFHLRNVTPAILASIITSMRPVSPDDTGFEVIPLPAEQAAFLVVNSWEKAWQPRIAIVVKSYLTALSNIIRLVNTGIEAAGGEEVGLEPWAALQDELRCAWEQWAPGERERLVGQVFPALPAWQGAADALRWLGDGVRKENERPKEVAPCLTLSFVPSRGLGFEGLGPSALLDEWFLALARATQLCAPESYTPFSERAAKSSPLLERLPLARA